VRIRNLRGVATTNPIPEVALLRRLRPRWVLVLANLVGCALFVALGPTAPPEYIAEVAAARANGGMYLNSGMGGMVACRLLHSWSEWHGGEALGVKVLEVANAPAAALTLFVAGAGEMGLARQFSVCGWSWLLAGVFLATASL
jgi:hypothetical protein